MIILGHIGSLFKRCRSIPGRYISAQPYAVQVWINLRIAGQSHQAGHTWGRARSVDVGIFLGQKIVFFSGFVGMIANDCHASNGMGCNQMKFICFMEGKNLGTAPTVSDSPLVYT